MDETAKNDWQRIRSVFEDVLVQPAEERRVYAQKLCGTNEILWNEVRSLLDWHESSESFLETPAVIQAIENNQLHNQLTAGQRLLHYEIRELIGMGGMGEVYLAHDARLDRNVAIKILRSDLLPHLLGSERLLREARAAALLEHPNICHIHEISEADGFSFIVMQYVVGTTLDDILAGGGIDVDTALDLGTQIAEGLAEAHSHGIIHRDIKPANIIVSEKGQAKILDFGLAKFIENETGADTANRIESSGGVMGTVPYMSPEQLLGGPVDARTDVFSFGALLFEMLSGVSAFGRERNDETISAILNDEPDRSLVSPIFRPLLQRCLAKDHANRYASAANVAQALAAARKDWPAANPKRSNAAITKRIDPAATDPAEIITAPFTAPTLNPVEASSEQIIAVASRPITEETSTEEKSERLLPRHVLAIPRKNRTWKVTLWSLVIAVLVLVGGVAGTLFLYTKEQKTDISLQSATFRRLTSSGTVYKARISPDGKFVAYSQLDIGAKSLWLRQIAAPNPVKVLSGSEWIDGITFSRDGSLLFYLTSTTDTPEPTLYRMPVLGGETLRLPHVTKSLFTFSPDGKQMAFYRHSPGNESPPVLTISNIDGTEERPLASVGDAAVSTDWQFAYLAWSPDGKTILVSLPDRRSTLSRIGAIAVASGEMTYLTGDEWVTTGHFEWTADSRSVVFTGRNRADRGSQLWQISYPGGEARQLTNDVNTYKSASLADHTPALMTVVTRYSANIWTVPISVPDQARQITQGTTFRTDPAFTPDDRIIFAAGPIFLMDENGENMRQLTDFSSNLRVSVSSSGFIVFDSVQKQRNGVYRMNANGDDLKLLTEENVEAAFPHVSPDGQWVFYLAFQKTNKSMPEILKKVSIEGGPSFPVLDAGLCDDTAVSPDGNYLACNYSETIDLDSNLAIIDLENGKPLRIFKGVYSTTNIRWSPSGEVIYYGDNNAGATNIWAQPINGDAPRQITNFTSDQIYGFDVSRDGNQLVLSRGTQGTDVVVVSDFK